MCGHMTGLNPKDCDLCGLENVEKEGKATGDKRLLPMTPERQKALSEKARGRTQKK
jgi:hypothetical protein